MFEMKNYHTINNFAKMYGVTTSYVYKLIKQGRIRATKIDGINFIDITKNHIKKG